MRFCPKFIELLVSFVWELFTIECHLIRRDRDFFTASMCRCGCFHMACALGIIDCLLPNCCFSLFAHALGKSFHAGVTIGFNRVNALFAKLVKIVQLGNVPDVVRVAVQRWVDFQNFIKSGNVEGKVEKDFFGRVNAPLRAVNNKVIVASDAEVERNPRARSAKLRIAELV